MAIFERIGDLMRANINDLIDRAENPEKMVKQIIIDMEDQIRKVTQSLGTAMGSQNQVKKQLDTARANSDSWKAKAKTALEAGNEDLAKQALANKVTQDDMVKQYEEMYNTISAQVNEIKQQVETLKVKLQEARNKQALIVARSQLADARMTASKSLGGTDSKSAFAKMDKMEQKVAAKEAQADAFSQISGTAPVDDPFAALEKDGAVNSELEALRRELEG